MRIQFRALISLFLLLITACSVAEDTAQASCDTLISETGAACTDMISRGLDVSCNEYIGAIEIAMDQAGGNLFDVGDANEKTANKFCSTYLKKLRKDRKENNHTMRAKSETSEQCSALAERFESSCVTKLGNGELPEGCRNVSRAFTMTSIKSLSQEQACNIAGMQLTN